jgi:MFS family permease
MTTPKPKLPNFSAPVDLKANLPKLCAVRAFFWMHFFSAVIVPFYTRWGGITLAEVLFLNAWFMFWNFVLEVPTGSVADRFGRKNSLILGHVIGAAAALVYVSRPGFANFMIAEVLFAAAYTLHSGADEALAYDSLGESADTASAKKILSRMESFKLGGIIAATLTGGFIATRWGLQAPMAFYIVPSALGLLVCLSLKEPVLHTGTQRPSYGRIVKEGTAYFLKHRILILLTAELALTHAMAWGLIWLFQPLLERAGLSIAWFGVVHAASCAGQIAVLSNATFFERLAGSRRRFLVAGSAVTGVSFLLLGFVHWLPGVIFFTVAGFSFGLSRAPIFNAYMHRFVPSEMRATVLSMTSMVRTFSIVVINPLIGLLAGRSLTLAMAVLGAGLLVLPFFSRLEEKHLAG